MKAKQKIYWDVDDVVLNSVETAIEIINEEFLTPQGIPNKTIQDVKDWALKSIYKDITPEQLHYIFSSSKFWARVKIKPEFEELLNSGLLDKYDNYFITKGSDTNHECKRYFLESHLKDNFKKFTYIKIRLDEDKNTVDMSGAIQIDDNVEFLINTNARLKILLTNLMETQYNNAFGRYTNQLPDNLYIVNDLKDVNDVLKFNLKERL